MDILEALISLDGIDYKKDKKKLIESQDDSNVNYVFVHKDGSKWVWDPSAGEDGEYVPYNDESDPGSGSGSGGDDGDDEGNEGGNEGEDSGENQGENSGNGQKGKKGQNGQKGNGGDHGDDYWPDDGEDKGDDGKPSNIYDDDEDEGDDGYILIGKAPNQDHIDDVLKRDSEEPNRVDKNGNPITKEEEDRMDKEMGWDWIDLVKDDSFTDQVESDFPELSIDGRPSSYERLKKKNQAVASSPTFEAFKEEITKLLKTQLGVGKKRHIDGRNRREIAINTYGRRIGAPEVKLGRDKPFPKVEKPVINVYLDWSGSWSDAELALAEKLRDEVFLSKEFMDKVVLRPFKYFGANVADTKEEVDRGNTDLREVIKDIQRTNPTNVVIVTDKDADWYSLPKVSLRGKAWLIFKPGSKSERLINTFAPDVLYYVMKRGDINA